MKALVYLGPNSVELREVPEPQAANDEVVVKVDAVGICGSDMHAYHGHDSRRPPPLVLGHEAAGRVVTGPRAGERVTINPLVVDPTCRYAVEGRWHLSPTRQIISMPPRPGAFAEFVRIPEANLVTVPDGFDMSKAALAEPIAVSWHAVRLGVEALFGPLSAARVAVLGGGAIGLTAALVLRLFGARDIALGEPNVMRRATAERCAPVRAYAPGTPDEPGANTVDLVIDAVGAAATRAAASRMVRPGGVIVHLGLLPGLDGLDVRKVTLQEITFRGSYCYTPADFRDTVAALVGGHLGPLDWFEERPLAEGGRAFADIDAQAVAAAKIVLRP